MPQQFDRNTAADALIDAVLEAGRVIMEIRARDFDVLQKADASPVTEADHAAEAVLVAAVERMAPSIPVVAEELAAAGELPRSVGQRFWLIDPLDGTREFIKGGTDFTVNVGLIEDGAPSMGLVYAPAQGRLFVGIAGVGAYERIADGTQRPLTVRRANVARLDVVASKSHRDEATNAFIERLRVDRLVSAGSSLKFCLVAAGEADVYPRFGPTMEWDTAAGHAVLAAAGGRVMHPDGRAFGYGKSDFRNGAFVAIGDAALAAAVCP